MIRLGYKYYSQQQIYVDGKRHKAGWSGFRLREDDNDEIVEKRTKKLSIIQS